MKICLQKTIETVILKLHIILYFRTRQQFTPIIRQPQLNSNSRSETIGFSENLPQQLQQQRSQQQFYGQQQLQQHLRRPVNTKKRKTFNFKFPFLTLGFKNYQVELSEFK